MDAFEAKACNMLQRLREIRAQRCCPHIDRQIDTWLDDQLGLTQHNHHNLLDEPPQLIPQPITQSPPQTHLQAPDDKRTSDERTIGCFLANLKHLESFDSDATESTSSNDSYDELEGFSHEEIPPKKPLPTTYRSTGASLGNQRASTSSLASNPNHISITPNQRRSSYLHGTETPSSSSAIANINDNFANMANLQKKSVWRWAKDRSRLASKWTWLQAQIADLEFRVRGQNEALNQAKARKIPPIPPIPESSCSRTVPLSRDFRNRCLIKSTQILSDSSKSSVKFSQVPCVCSSLPQTVAACLSCKGRYNYLKQIEGENAPLQERAAQIDPCCHPVLSHPDDITLGSQISYLLKKETINRKPPKGKPGRKKASLTAAAMNQANDDKSSAKHVGKKGKWGMSGRAAGHAQGGHLKNPSSIMASNKLKRKYRASKHSTNNQANNFDSISWSRANNSHAHDNNNNSNSTKRNKRFRSTSSMNEAALYSDSSNPYRPAHFNNGAVRQVTRRRRSEQSAYDINNIVIPYGIAASTRVEILEYKEIRTPSWRVVDNNGTCDKDNTNNTEESIKKEPEDMDEDTSDEAYVLRHTKGEHEEKKRFSLKPPPKNDLSKNDSQRNDAQRNDLQRNNVPRIDLPNNDHQNNDSQS